MNSADTRPVLIVIAGPNGSGKTSVTRRILHHEWTIDTEYINPDNVAQERFGDWNSPQAVLQSVHYCEELRERCLANHRSLIFETVLSADDKVDYICRAREAGYFIRLFFVCTEHPAINAARIARRVMEGGHDVPITKIIARYERSIANCSLIASMVDRAYFYDNSVDNADARPLFRLTDGHIAREYTASIPEWAADIYQKAHE